MNSCYRLACFAALALVLVGAGQVDLLAQKVDWKAGELASPFPAVQTEEELIKQLQTATVEGKAMACKQLSIYGSEACVPELAKLLSDEKLASWSRIALEAIPSEACDEALVEAAGKLKGKLLVGVINSIGERRSEDAMSQLEDCLHDDDEQVAAAAAVALGEIGNETAVHTLHGAFASAPPAVRSAIAEGGILCAERMMDEGQVDFAVQIYDVIRKADLPKQRVLEATRGAILARGGDGIPLLVEQLKSSDKQMFQMALSTARQLKAEGVVEALSDELADASPERASLIIYAIGDRGGVVLPKSMLQAASKGDDQVRLAAIELVGRLGDATAVPTLLEVAVDSNEELSQAAKKAIAGLAGKKVDAELAARLPSAKGNSLGVLIELVGERRIEATPELVKAMKNSDKAIREAALAALGETVSADDLDVLVAKVVEADNEGDRSAAEKALHTASIRMPQREATAEELTDAMSDASPEAKASILRILGAMGGPKALETIAAAIKSDDDQMQNIGTDVLGKWMTADAAPVLLEYVKDTSKDKRYRDRAFKGYLRIARQLKQLPDDERLAIAKQALEIAQRPDQRILVLQVLERCPSSESIKLASALVDDKEVRDEAVQTAILIGEKIKDKDPAAAKSAGEKALKVSPPKALADRARALTSP